MSNLALHDAAKSTLFARDYEDESAKSRHREGLAGYEEGEGGGRQRRGRRWLVKQRETVRSTKLTGGTRAGGGFGHPLSRLLVLLFPPCVRFLLRMELRCLNYTAGFFFNFILFYFIYIYLFIVNLFLFLPHGAIRPCSCGAKNRGTSVIVNLYSSSLP